MKRYNVVYSVTISYEAQVTAHSEKEAKAKVKEVIGEPLKFEGVWELKESQNG